MCVMSVNKMSVDKMCVDGIPVDEISIDKMSVDEISFDQKTRTHLLMTLSSFYILNQKERIN